MPEEKRLIARIKIDLFDDDTYSVDMPDDMPKLVAIKALAVATVGVVDGPPQPDRNGKIELAKG